MRISSFLVLAYIGDIYTDKCEEGKRRFFFQDIIIIMLWSFKIISCP